MRSGARPKQDKQASGKTKPRKKGYVTPRKGTRTSPRKAVGKKGWTPNPSPQKRGQSPRTPVKTPVKKGNKTSAISTPTKATWTTEKEETLAQEWKEHEYLYNLKLDDYRDNRKKEIALQKIASKIDVTGKVI